MISGFKPRLEGMPASTVGLLGSPIRECPEHPTCLLTGIRNGQGEVARLVLGVELVTRGGRDKAGRAFFGDAPWPQPSEVFSTNSYSRKPSESKVRITYS